MYAHKLVNASFFSKRESINAFNPLENGIFSVESNIRTLEWYAVDGFTPDVSRSKLSVTEAPNPGVAAFIGFATQAKPTRFESAGTSTLHSLSFGFNPGDARDRSLIGRCVLSTPLYVGQFLGQ